MEELNGIIAGLNQKVQELNSRNSEPFINMGLVCSILQGASAEMMKAPEKVLPLSEEERGNVCTAFLAMEKSLIEMAIDDKKDGAIIWVPKSECGLYEQDKNDEDHF